jgi:hypothetical protein
MSKQTILRKASDNPYFHKDFHIALNNGIDYLHKNFGEKAVREYLTQFASAYYAPLKRALEENGLLAIREHYEKIYKIESAVFDMVFSQDELIIHLSASPAVLHIKKNGHPVSPCFHETVTTVNKEICSNTLFECELLEYKQENGSYRLRFFRRTI